NLPTRPKYLRSTLRLAPFAAARRSTKRAPALCRVWSYSGPGFPRPTISCTAVTSEALPSAGCEWLLGSAFFFRCVFLAHARRVNVDDRQVAAVLQGDESNAFRQLQVAHVQNLADFHLGDVDFDEVRQVLRQAGHFGIGQVQVGLATLLLDADGGFLVDQVHRNGGGQLLAGDDALEVSVQNEALGRLTLQRLDHHVLALAIDAQLDDVAEGDFVFQHLGQVFGQNADRLRRSFATVDHGRYEVGVTTQAAARTFPQVGTLLGIQFEVSHCVSPGSNAPDVLATSTIGRLDKSLARGEAHFRSARRTRLVA